MKREVKEKVEVGQEVKTPTLQIEITEKGKENLIKLQGQYQVKHLKKINLKDLGSKIFEHATLNF
jgi:hypothetical protein